MTFCYELHAWRCVPPRPFHVQRKGGMAYADSDNAAHHVLRDSRTMYSKV